MASEEDFSFLHRLVEIRDTPSPVSRQYDCITLLPPERLFIQLILEYLHQSPWTTFSAQTQVWFTGGWVRDKLLGIESMDIDAALSFTTGTQFMEGLEEYYNANKDGYTKEAKRLGVSSFFHNYLVRKQPEKSKHLETTTVRLFGLEVDFVNLRSETYLEDSRNPQMAFATAEEDAFRRDATINALFYNVVTGELRDFTGQGLRDLDDGLLRTPLDPYQTFLDDPLRVLRLIRFASKLGFTVDREAEHCMMDENVHLALNTKITRERIKTEVMKMIQSRHPRTAFELLHRTGLYATVFLNETSQTYGNLRSSLPNTASGSPWPPTWPNTYRLIENLAERSCAVGKHIEDQASVAGDNNVWILAALASIASLGDLHVKQAIFDVGEAIRLTHGTSKLLEASLKNRDDIRAKVKIVEDHEHSRRRVVRDLKLCHLSPVWTHCSFSFSSFVSIRFS